jgi:hypothetical protein
MTALILTITLGVGTGVIILGVCGDMSQAKLGFEPRSSRAKCWAPPTTPHHVLGDLVQAYVWTGVRKVR